MIITNKKIGALVTMLATGLLGLQSAQAADALAICESGVPFAYPGGGVDIPYNPDLGPLGPLTNAQGVAAVELAFDRWEDLPQSSMTALNAGFMPFDVDITNFGPILNPLAPDGLSPIVFDADGSIFALLFGPGSGILGFAGPDFGDPATCELLEGSSFLNGPTFTNALVAEDIMVHEFGHYINLGHVELNGQLVGFSEGGDDEGPSPDGGTYPYGPIPTFAETIETMYPFYFGATFVGTRTPHADDIASIANIYPAPDYAATTGTISGSILSGFGAGTRISGVNVIARNIANPYLDSVSTFSGAYTNSTDPADPVVGTYTLSGLTPGADYVVFVDVVTAAPGRFSNPILTSLPGPEEFYNGADESNDGSADNPQAFELITAIAGSTTTADIHFNIPPPGVPLPLFDEAEVSIPLPFPFCVAGQAYDTAFIHDNGYLSLGGGTGFSFFINVADFLSGPARIAGLWTDLNTGAGGTVIYEFTDSTFTVTYDSVPEWPNQGSNTFSIELRDNSATCVAQADDDGDSDSDSDSDSDARHFSGKAVKITHGDVSTPLSIVGVSAGLFATSGFEEEIDLSARSRDGRRPLTMKRDAAVFEVFFFEPVDIGRLSFKRVGREYRDRFEHNDSLDRAARVGLPFDTIDTFNSFSSISPAADDIDFYQFRDDLESGTTFVAEVLSGQVDTVMGLFKCADDDADSDSDSDSDSNRCDPATAVLVAANDDSNGLLSKITFVVPEDGTYALAVTFCCDFNFDGDDPGQGGALDVGRYVLDVFVIDGIPLTLFDDDAVEIPLDFAFPFQGVSYTSVFVNSNGHLTFGVGDPFSFVPSVPAFEGGPPRIAPLWTDLNPSAGGLIFFRGDSGSMTVNFLGVPEFPAFGSNTMSVTLTSTGQIINSYAGLTATGGITGVAEGGGAPGTAVDLSSSSSWPATGTTYEEFFGGFDLDGSVLTFEDP